MMRPIFVIFLLWSQQVFCSSPIEDWEAQKYYDLYLLETLREAKSAVDNFPDFSMVTETYSIGEEIRTVQLSAPKSYTYYLMSKNDEGVKIKAENRYGGRDYIYDSEWNVTSYLFDSPAEARKVGNALIKWLAQEKHIKNMDKTPKDNPWISYAISLGFRGCYTDQLYFDDTRFDMLGSFGGFLVYEDLQPKIWEIVAGGSIFADDAGREKVVRGIISNYENYSGDLQQEVLKKLGKYLETVDDEKTNYSKKIAEFVLEKGGAVPDRLYWEYNTAWHPFHGSESFESNRKKSKKPAAMPRSAGSSDSSEINDPQ
jgi:hypothetical protein